ncbi:hypothetical protein EG68_12283 [Paragonimus skrjabini miyazakii]|uniref:Uncharacterized protein n=1 Tax=Paragonimus skrjabini miyazakii TaxID=59628 RepID=A0A8S9YFJ7_9TREM|nr:hypothetical protein EG68_12283 [Paragonimus skrjabini miyazakii]
MSVSSEALGVQDLDAYESDLVTVRVTWDGITRKDEMYVRKNILYDSFTAINFIYSFPMGFTFTQCINVKTVYDA